MIKYLQSGFLSASMLALLVLILLGCGSAKDSNDILKVSNLQVVGRYAIEDEKLELITSAAHFGVKYKGATCTIQVSISDWQDHNYLQYELDGVYQKRLRIQGPQDTLQVVAPNDGEHILKIYKATEAHSGPVFIHQLEAEEIKPISIPDSPVIEFIGNSITCGAAADGSETPCGSGEYHDQHNAYQAYGPRVARALNAEYVLSSVSGIGIYRNWNSDKPIMPEVYAKTDLQETSTRLWNFKTFTPEIVSIALGTNDMSRGDGIKPRLPFDSTTFISGYVNFVKTVKEKYPNAKIALLNSPMIGGAGNDLFVACLNSVKRQIDAAYPQSKPVSIFLVTPMVPRGCSYHPSVEDHQILAEELKPLYEKLLKEGE